MNWTQMLEGACIVVACLVDVNPNLPFCIGAPEWQVTADLATDPLFELAFTWEHLTLLKKRETTVRKFRMDRESNLVEKIARAFRSGAMMKHAHRAGLRLGIGDDAAIISPSGENDWVLSCDAFLEGVHFTAKTHPPDSAGYKSLVRATSDLGAMGATPRYFLLTLAIPASRTGAWLDQFLKGMARAARSMKMLLAGGDTTKSDKVSISVTVIGEIARGGGVARSGAQPGDIIYISGRLGRAQLGLNLLLHGNVSAKGFPSTHGGQAASALRAILQPHLYPEIRLALGAWLARHRLASAMIDLSDGLSTDLTRVCQASRVGAEIQSAAIPSMALTADLSKYKGRLKLDPLQMALNGGEDYELLFTVPPRKVKKLREAPGFSRLTPIGEATRSKSIVIIGADGAKKPLKPQGWDPFRR
jgi:thiamine-monophosphate kinase